MKCKVLTGNSPYELQIEVEKFLQTIRNLHHISYSTCAFGSYTITVQHSALLIYD